MHFILLHRYLNGEVPHSRDLVIGSALFPSNYALISVISIDLFGSRPMNWMLIDILWEKFLIQKAF